jgi:UDP-N-acetylmuramoyl-L-alanyl-D-glutamate--2,6-diaminopimelate ligase
MKLLKDLLYRTRIEQIDGSTNTAIEQLTFDSRAVVPFTAFVAIKGTQRDGHDHIDEAIAKGAVSIVCERLPRDRKDGVTYVRVADAQHALGIMAANFFDHPSRQMKLVGVTGTNGKTSVATLLHRLFRSLGHKSGLISTVEIKVGNTTIASTHTTPDAVRLNELLARMVANPEAIEPSMTLVLVSRNLERIGDLATNIAEEVVFIAEARVIKHHAEDGPPKDEFGRT